MLNYLYISRKHRVMNAKEERILADVEWCKDFKHVTPLEMAQGMILNHAESLGREDGFLDEFHLTKIRHWVEVKKRLNE